MQPGVGEAPTGRGQRQTRGSFQQRYGIGEKSVDLRDDLRSAGNGIGQQWCKLSARTSGPPSHPSPGSLEQFITEHYWGYSSRRNGGCLEYHVSHVPWEVWTAPAAAFEGDARILYGRELGAVLDRSPESAFVASGSPVTVFRGVRVL